MQSARSNGQSDRQEAVGLVEYFVHPSADVSPEARIGKGTRIWNRAQVREGAVLGRKRRTRKSWFLC
jgi:carbonic anhydrase/acetyltransferase-like protein (isoleucine patch superfamily)